ncbi:hypothetical protein IV102_26525 [bacterium]|nr:hypothetical protein [bacterium]
MKSRNERAVALMLAIFLTSFLFILGLTMLIFIDRDTRAGLNLQRSQQAQAAAQSGMFFARKLLMRDVFYGTTTLTAAPVDFYALDPAGLEGFQLWKDAIGDVHSLGMVRDASGTILMRRELASPSNPESLLMENSWDVDL